MHRRITGINIQWPWSRALLSGEKTVETRGYPLPKKYLGIDLALIETPGPEGRKNGVRTARIVGIIRFDSVFQYQSRKQWTDDFGRHRVAPDDPAFAFKADKAKWGWVVGTVRRFQTPVVAPYPRGIVFASQCEVPLKPQIDRSPRTPGP